MSIEYGIVEVVTYEIRRSEIRPDPDGIHASGSMETCGNFRSRAEAERVVAGLKLADAAGPF